MAHYERARCAALQKRLEILTLAKSLERLGAFDEPVALGTQPMGAWYLSDVPVLETLWLAESLADGVQRWLVTIATNLFGSYRVPADGDANH